jgi:DNA-binding beta-propeller fold protein YncE
VLPVLTLVVGGCGSVGFVGDLPPAAEPARSPALAVEPAGQVVAIGNRPEGVVADARTGVVAVGLREPDELALVDAATASVRRRVPLPGAPRHLSLAAPGGPVLVPAERADALVRVDLPGGAAGEVPVGVFPHDAAAAQGRIFVGDERGNTLSVVDGDDVQRFRVATQPGGVTAIADGNAVAVVSVRERVLEVFDARRLQRRGRIAVGAGPTHAAGGSEGRVYVVDTTGDALLVVETRPHVRIARRVALAGGPYGLAVDRERGRLWITLTETNEVVQLSGGARPRILETYPAVRQPNTVAVEERSGRVFVTGTADGVLQVLDPRRSP